MGSIIGHRVEYNGVGALRGQWHIPNPKRFVSFTYIHTYIVYLVMQVTEYARLKS